MNRKLSLASTLLVLLVPCLVHTQPPQTCQQPLDVVILVDASGSICDNDPTKVATSNGHATCSNWQNVLSFTNAYVNAFNIGPGPRDTRVAVIRFGNSARVLWKLSDYTTKAALQNAVNTQIFYPGLGQNTDTQDALDLARTQVLTAANGARDNILDVVIVITDGKSTVHPEKTLPNAQLLKDRGVTIVSVGVTSLIDIKELCAMASPRPEYCMTQPTFSALANSLNNLITTSCVTATVSPVTPAPDPVCNQNLDVAILLDASGSICDNNPTKVSQGNGHATCNNWQTILDFVGSFIRAFRKFGPQGTQVAVIRFGNTGQVLWKLPDYQTQDALLNAVQTKIFYPELGQKTNTQQALTLADTQIFTAANGDRPSTRNLALVITDGKSTVDQQNTLPAAQQLKSHNVTIIAVGVTSDVDLTELCNIASPPAPNNPNVLNCFQQPSFDLLKQILFGLVTQACLPAQGPAVLPAQ